GSLIRACVRVGGMLGGATQDDLESLSRYGEHIGLTFQIIDDILDVVGEEAKLGKGIGSDAAQAKVTFPAVFGLDVSRSLAEQAVRSPHDPYASRGGIKLAHALAVFGVDVRGKVAVDLGASTGGFTDCLLRAGAARVYAVDVGRGQLAERLRSDPRVVCLEGVNARYLTADRVGSPCDLVTIDLAFISLRLIWRPVAGLVSARGSVIALVKPQFEAGRAQVRRGGVVRDPNVHRAVLGAVVET